MGDQVVLGHSTHGKPYSPFYEDNYWNNDVPIPSEGVPLTLKAIPQGDTLGNIIQGPKPLHICGGIN